MTRVDGNKHSPLGQSFRQKVLAHAATRLTDNLPETAAADVAQTLRSFLKVEGHRLRMAHLAGTPGCEIASLRSFAIDIAVGHAFGHATSDFGAGHGYGARNGCALIAIGGYGRAELAPYSDIDLLFLYSSRHTDEIKPALEHFLRLLWDARLTVGHCFRTVGDSITAARTDPHFQTAVMNTRLLAGNKALYHSLLDALEKDRRKRADLFVARIRREREMRYAKFGAAVLLQEPNIKESAGGLRDYQTALWSAYAGLGCKSFDELRGRNLIAEDEAKRVQQAYDFMWRIRHSMHFLTRRKTEYLTLDIQANLAGQLGYLPGAHLLASEKLMRDYYARARELHAFSEKLLARSSDERSGTRWWRKRPAETRSEPFLIRGGCLQFDGAPECFGKDPAAIFKAFALAQAARVPFDYHLREIISRSLLSIDPNWYASGETVNAFVKLLGRRGRAGHALRLMHEVGFLARIVPEFRRVSLLAQHDLYHHYTVDEHTLKAAEALDALYASGDKNRSHLRVIFEDVEDPGALYLAVLLHDIGKGRGRGHIARGAKLAERICRRLGLPEARAEGIVLLVQHHVTMAHLAQRRDLNEPRVITEFTARLGSLDTLNMLLLLTYADLNAVGPGVWTEWKASLLWDLYRRARKQMTGQEAPDDGVEELVQFKEEIAKALDPPLLFSEIERHLALLPERYIRITTAETAAIHLRLIEELKSATIACRWRRHEAALTELTICTLDRHGLVADLAGTLAANGIEILGAEVNTREDGIAIDLFMLRQASTRQALDTHRYAVIEQALRKAVAGELDVPALVDHWRMRNAPRRLATVMPNRRRDLPRVICDNEASQTSTLVEIHALDEVGLVHKIACAMTRLGLDIVCARIATERSDALDVFYVTDKDGARLSEADMSAVKDALTGELLRGR